LTSESNGGISINSRRTTTSNLVSEGNGDIDIESKINLEDR